MISRISSHTGASNRFVKKRNFSSCNIITDGLQLHLDAGNLTSYPGTGTTIYDLSVNGYNSTLINSVGFSTNGGGTLTFDATNDYIDVNQSLSYETFTVGAWFKSSAAGIKMIISKETFFLFLLFFFSI